MKYLLPIFLAAALLTGCEQKHETHKKSVPQAEHNVQEVQQTHPTLMKAPHKKEIPANKKAAPSAAQGKLTHLGITTTPDGKIIIDTNKTKSYLEQLAKQMKAKADEFAKEMQQGAIEEKEVGIEVNQSKIVIDLNKTQNFMEKWTQKMQGFVKDMEKLSETIDGDINSSAPGQ